jgi:alanyl aminopeptidase
MRSPLSPRACLGLAVLALAAARPSFATEYPRLGDAAAPTAQAISLTLDPAKADYHGTVRIELEVRRETSEVRFHARGQELRDIALAGAEDEIRATTLSRQDDIAVLTAARPLEPGRYRLTLSFTQKYNTRAVGLYKADFQGAPYLFTQLEATEAREAFPCWDEPAFKIPWTLTLTVPAGLTAIANMPVASESQGEGSKTLTFAASPPMPSYLVAVAVGPFETVPVAGTSMPTRIVTAKGQSALAAVAARETPAIVAALERYFGRPYPYPKLDLIAVPEFAYGAMENAGAITFADRILLVDSARVAPTQLRALVTVTAHELAHMWFGDLVTMRWWDDFWLNESFADWMADKITAEVHPELDSALDEVAARSQALAADARPSALPIRPQGETTPDQAMQNVGQIYAKGSAVLEMVEHWIGEEASRRGVNAYLSAHAWGNATGPDLWNALGKAAGKDVAGMLSGFIVQSGAPLVSVEAAGGSRYRFRQRRYSAAGVEVAPATWRVPLTLRYRDGAGVKAWSGELAGETLEVTLPASGAVAWLMPNAEAAGYYRFALPERELDALLAAAGSDLTPAERIGLVGNLQALLQAGSLPGDRYLEALARLAADREPAVARAVAAALEEAGDGLVPPAAGADYAAFLRRSFGERAAALDWRPAPGERVATTLLRPVLLELVGGDGEDPALRAAARRLAEAALAEPAAVDESVAKVALTLAARGGDRALWNAYRARFEGAQAPNDRARFLDLLGQFGDPALARAALDYALTDAVRPTELLRIPFMVGFATHREDEVFDWLTRHYDEIAGRIPPFVRAFLPFAAAGCSAERWRRAEAFFADPAHRVPGIEQQMAQAGEGVAACVRLRQREGEAVARWLAKRP